MSVNRTEVFDYLRNQQKAAEIEAQMNGVNLWVLFGAMAVVAWQLLSTSNARLWGDHELVARTLVVTAALYLMSWLIVRSAGDREDLRFRRLDVSEVESPFLVLLMGLLLMFPSAYLWAVAGKSIGPVVPAAIGAAFVAVSAVAIVRPIFPVLSKKERLPKPEFGPTRAASATSELLIAILGLATLVEQVSRLANQSKPVVLEDAKSMVLLSVLYLLVFITITRRLRSDSIAWTYELETDLLLGVTSPETAIQKIESRRLGPRLQDVIDRFFADLERNLAEAESGLLECAEKVRLAKEVPAEYPAERAARLKSASDDLNQKIDKVTDDCKEFRAYLTTLEELPNVARKAALTPVVASLKARYQRYAERHRSVKAQFESMFR